MVLQLMQTLSIKLVQIHFGWGGNVMRVRSKPGCERPGVELEYLLVTAPDGEEYTLWIMGDYE